jgi:hypothetical protein
MAIQLECPGCKAILQVEDSLAGMQGKCIHCGHKVIVPAAGAPLAPFAKPSPSPAPMPPAAPLTVTKPAAAPSSAVIAHAPPPPSSKMAKAPPPPPVKAAGPIATALFEATPEAMMRELAARGESAVMFLFRPSAEGSYDLAEIADDDLKCIVTEDINNARFAQWVESVSKRFGLRKRPQTAAAAATSEEPPAAPAEYLYELKGDQLGMSLDEFKRRYARGEEGTRGRLPLLSNEAWGADRAALYVETWHQQAGIIHARIDLPTENNPPTVAGVKTDLLLYQFVDGQLFRISAIFPTDLFHLVSEAAVAKYGKPTSESQRPRQLIWDNPMASVTLARGAVHPPEPSQLILVHKGLSELAASRAPTRAGDI